MQNQTDEPRHAEGERRPLAAWERALIEQQRVACLATVDETGQPHVVPIVYAFDGERLFTPLDAKPKRVSPRKLRRVRNLEAQPQVAVLIDAYDEDWQKLAWVQLRGVATVVEEGEVYRTAQRLLTDKYPQYINLPLENRPLIVVWIHQVVSWRATGA